MSHWFAKQELCIECGEAWGHESHKRTCDGTYSGFGPGFSFCELEEGHDGPHLLHPFNGSEWLVEDGALETATQTRPSRSERGEEL